MDSFMCISNAVTVLHKTSVKESQDFAKSINF